MHKNDSKDFLKTLQSMGQISDVKDVVDAIVYLTEAHQVTGEVLHVDGGANGQSAFFERMLQYPRVPGHDVAGDLAKALKRAAAAHGWHEARTGQADPNWPDWYAEYMVREQFGEGPPQ